VTPEQRTEWLAWRREGIGASDVAGIIGMSEWSSPVSVWLDKTMTVEKAATEPMEWGLILEDTIIDEWARRNDRLIGARQAMASRVDAPHHRATIDALDVTAPATPRIVEAKNTSDWPWTEPPDKYLLQVQWQLHVMELDEASMVVLHSGNRLADYPVVRDDKTIGLLVDRVDHFWHTFVAPGVMPPVDDSRATHTSLKEAFADPTDRPVTLEGDAVKALERHRELRAEIKTLESEMKGCESVIFAALGDAEIGTVDGEPAVSWKRVEVGPSVREGYSFRKLTRRGEYR
jgi:putative phage-type endonuclease